MTTEIDLKTVNGVVQECINSLESTLLFFKKNYFENRDQLTNQQKQNLEYRLTTYFEILLKIQTFSVDILHNNRMDKLELYRNCVLILQLFDFVQIDAKDLCLYLDTGNFPDTPKEACH